MNVEMNARINLTLEEVLRYKQKSAYSNLCSSLWWSNTGYYIEGTFYFGQSELLNFRIDCETEVEARNVLREIRKN